MKSASASQTGGQDRGLDLPEVWVTSAVMAQSPGARGGLAHSGLGNSGITGAVWSHTQAAARAVVRQGPRTPLTPTAAGFLNRCCLAAGCAHICPILPRACRNASQIRGILVASPLLPTPRHKATEISEHKAVHCNQEHPESRFPCPPPSTCG